MPQVGENLTTGVIVEWFKSEMDPVEKGETLLSVESEKAVFEVVAEDSGVLLKVLHEVGAEVRVLKPVAYIGKPGETPAAGEPTADTDEPAAVAPEPARHSQPLPVPPRRGFASPAARRLARERGLSLNGVRGTGPRQRIVVRDVQGALARVAGSQSDEVAVTAAGALEPFNRMRQHIAVRMSLSARTKPHFYLSVDVDMTKAQTQRRSASGQLDGGHVSITDLLIRTTARALRRFQRLNAYVTDEGTRPQDEVNIGVAIAVSGGLLVPVVTRADSRSLAQINRARRDNVEAAGRGVLRRSGAATFTIANLGMYGIARFFPLINPPECAILAAGHVEERVVARGGQPLVRQIMTLTLACDHRAVDGDYAARFLNDIKGDLEDPASLF